MTPEAQRTAWRRAQMRHRIRHGLHRGPNPIDPALAPDRADEAARLYRQGRTVAETAAAIGATYDQVHGALRRAGVAMRPRGRRRRERTGATP